MTEKFPLHLIPLLPFLGAAFALLFGKRAGKGIVTFVSCGVIAAAALVSVVAVVRLHHLPPAGALVATFFDAPWIQAGDLNIAAGLLLDHLSAVMILVVTGIGFLIHIYSMAYMEHDAGYTKFFGYLNLFMGSMLILVLGDSMLVTFVGWEGVGLCSYLLIGFWFDKEAFAYAGRKAFVVNRVGDFGFLLAMFLLFSYCGTLKYGDLASAKHLGDILWWGQPVAFFVGLLVIVGATGKSAQIPLYVWLPDAMAGPTPVSALIHAATMVTAGVYVVARMNVVFNTAPLTLVIVAIIGAATALFAATIGFAQKDLKKVLAYSTISQLGFMFVGVGSYVNQSSNHHAGIFHLVTHAFFKAGLFLGAGSVMHAMSGEGDITRMGGLKKWLPHTHKTFLIFCLAIAGIPPFAGFWSKDAILGGAAAAHWPAMPNAGAAEVFFANHLGTILFWVLLVAAGCTAFYMFRLYLLVFRGDFRGTPEEAKKVHESPPAMTTVLWILALGSIFIGFLGIPDAVWHGANIFGEWLEPVVREQNHEESLREFLMFAGFGTGASVLGILGAWLLYGNGFSVGVRNFVAKIPWLYKLVLDKYRIDGLYDIFIIKPFRMLALLLWRVVDSFLIDMVLVNGVGFVVNLVGKLVRYVQNGDAQRYVVGIVVGVAVIFWGASNMSVRNARSWKAQVDKQTVTVSVHGGTETEKRLRFAIDWNNDGKFTTEESGTSFRHTYDKPGKKRITVKAIDPRWATDATESQTVNLP